MQWIEMPVIDGESTILKLINLSLYQHLESFEDGTKSKLFEPDGDTNIVIDVYYEVLARQFRAIPGWIQLTIPDIIEATTRVFNLSFYKIILQDGDGVTLFEQDGHTSIKASETYAALVLQVKEFTGGENGWPQFEEAP